MPLPLVTDFEELEGSPVVKMTAGGDITATRNFKVRWDLVPELLRQLTPYPTNWFASFPGIPALRVDSASVQRFKDMAPLDTDAVHQHNAYEFAQVDVDYKVPRFEGGGRDPSSGQPTGGGGGGQDNSPRKGQDPQADNDTLLSHKMSIGAEFLVMPNAGIRWFNAYDSKTNAYNTAAGNYKVNEEVNAGILIPTVEHTVTWHRVRLPPWAAVKRCVGKVNKKPFADHPAETLLFLGVEAQIDFTSTDTKWWQLDFKFQYKNYKTIFTEDPDDPEWDSVLWETTGTGLVDKGWNHFYRPETGRFERMCRRGASTVAIRTVVGGTLTVLQDVPDELPGKPIYELAEFKGLFKMEY